MKNDLLDFENFSEDCIAVNFFMHCRKNYYEFNNFQLIKIALKNKSHDFFMNIHLWKFCTCSDLEVKANSEKF